MSAATLASGPSSCSAWSRTTTALLIAAGAMASACWSALDTLVPSLRMRGSCGEVSQRSTPAGCSTMYLYAYSPGGSDSTTDHSALLFGPPLSSGMRSAHLLKVPERKQAWHSPNQLKAVGTVRGVGARACAPAPASGRPAAGSASLSVPNSSPSQSIETVSGEERCLLGESSSAVTIEGDDGSARDDCPLSTAPTDGCGCGCLCGFGWPPAETRGESFDAVGACCLFALLWPGFRCPSGEAASRSRVARSWAAVTESARSSAAVTEGVVSRAKGSSRAEGSATPPFRVQKRRRWACAGSSVGSEAAEAGAGADWRWASWRARCSAESFSIV
mmetsp:Transcript_2200/g.6934  ORF Transcript_2200/g.6934 Transcript_2200/m.6934 type:complete len:332 (-) Transcript_2200:1063-2058(-)|eukprot:scaffold290172_cov24-Tisochrysis_lutea.AAC.3